MHPLLEKLTGGDRRSVGRVKEVILDVRKNPKLLRVVFAGMFDSDPLVSMRAADALEKITGESPALLVPFKRRLLRLADKIHQQEVRWHVAQMIPRLPLSPRERKRAAEVLEKFLEDDSRIVKTFAMQALAELAGSDAQLKKRILPMIADLTAHGSPAMKARGRKLLMNLR